MGQASDQPSGDGYIYALTDEAAYLQTDEDEKPPITAEPPPDPAWFKCWFCRKSHPQVQGSTAPNIQSGTPTPSPSSTVVTERPDVLVVKGGVVEVPGRIDLGWNFGLPVGTAFACMCEPMLLALEGRHATTAGVDTPVAVRHDLARWALLHGFRLARLQGFGRPVLEEDWARIREVRYPTRRSTRAAPAGLGG